MRSSTNAEDLPGFNGAGLYRSVVLPARPTTGEVATGIRQVWASVWNLAAFEERKFYRIDHSRVAMAVLVQQSVDRIAAIGVGISGNPFDAQRPGVFVNVQPAGGSVTDAGGDDIPEQWLIYTYLSESDPTVLSRSSKASGRPVLSAAEATELARRISSIHDRMVGEFRGGLRASNAVDVEFVVAHPDRKIIFVQARPYRLDARE